MIDIRLSLLWQSAFDIRKEMHPAQVDAVRRLLAAYNALEERIAPMLALIPRDCEGLTIHDISHVHQLWHVSDQICGPDFKLNPLEGFVLAAAFLIHDAGLTAATYPGGLPAIEESQLYQDIIAYKTRANQNSSLTTTLPNAIDRAKREALFETLRLIHADRAAHIMEMEFRHPLVEKQYYLLPDLDLLLDCGEIIGRIAASHHWPIKKVTEEFKEPLSPPNDFPGWTIDAFKLACILRCGDACAIDERRARIMPFILFNPKGVSHHHWDFQARLKPAHRRNDLIVFESKIPFDRRAMNSWWTAYDAIAVADSELRDCDKQFRTRAQRSGPADTVQFAAKGVDGAGDPDRLKSLVKVSGWLPVDTSVRIANPISLIEKLGGWALYGDDLIAPLRELIQNAADAIRARAAFSNDNSFRGCIDIKFDVDIKSDQLKPFMLSVSDNGIGMPKNHLTDTLLDFGKSLWSSDRLPAIYPGLANNSEFQPTGRFGIGFYSTFMIGDDVKVISRPWDSALQDTAVLHFKNGIRSRAELRPPEGDTEALAYNRSTSVILNVKNLRFLNTLAQNSWSIHNDDDNNLDQYWIFIEKTISRLVFSLDAECRLQIGSQPPKIINRPEIFNLSNDEFAKYYNEIMLNSDDGKDKITDEEINLITSIADNRGKVHTRGLIASDSNGGRIQVGGLSVFRKSDGLIKGVVAYDAGTAARQGGRRVALESELRNWASQQILLMEQSSIGEEKLIRAVAGASDVGVDITESARVRANGQVVLIRELIASFDSPHVILAFEIQRDPFKRPYLEMSSGTFGFGYDIDDIILLENVVFTGGSGRTNTQYDIIDHESGTQKREYTAFSIICKQLRQAGYSISFEGPHEFHIGNYCGPEGGTGRLKDPDIKPGMRVTRWCLCLTATQSV